MTIEEKYIGWVRQEGRKMSDEQIKALLHKIYEVTGADTDGDTTFHCSVEDAFKFTLLAVEALRRDYDECLTSLK